MPGPISPIPGGVQGWTPTLYGPRGTSIEYYSGGQSLGPNTNLPAGQTSYTVYYRFDASQFDQNRQPGDFRTIKLDRVDVRERSTSVAERIQEMAVRISSRIVGDTNPQQRR